jgi:universal stress protein A
MENILVAVRATEGCVRVIGYAATMARQLGARLYVLDVVHNPFGYQGWNLPMISVDEEYQRLLKKGREQLHGLVMEEMKKGLQAEAMVREGDPTTVITQLVDEKKIELLVLAAHPEDRIEHFFFGKANEKLIREMPCSILLFREGLYGSCA